MYQIIEVHIKYQENKITELAVLWVENELGWVRASYCNTKPCWGYKFLIPDEILTPRLIQDVAGSGINLPDQLKKVYFPGKRKWGK